MSLLDVRMEVMQSLEKDIAGFTDKYLIPVEQIWQPSDFLPDSREENFITKVKELKEAAMELDYDFWIVLIGDMITEEALPTYESWLMNVQGVDQENGNAWSSWICVKWKSARSI
jgi:acyl-[acyl-carrier-protein] desaturase